jgi:hypothetical protein
MNFKHASGEMVSAKGKFLTAWKKGGGRFVEGLFDMLSSDLPRLNF